MMLELLITLVWILPFDVKIVASDKEGQKIELVRD